MISSNLLDTAPVPSAQTTSREPHVQLMTVTPELAARWLSDCNIKNRRLKPEHVECIARDIRAGNWCTTHQGIAFSCDGKILDGQHRLSAVVRAQIPVRMYIWFNVSPQSLLAIDRQAIRDKADTLCLTNDGGRVSRNEVATLQAMIIGLGENHPLTVAEAQAAFIAHRDALEFAHKHLPAGRARGVANMTTRAVVARAWYSADLDRLRQFLAAAIAAVGYDLKLILDTRAANKAKLLVALWMARPREALATCAQGEASFF